MFAEKIKRKAELKAGVQNSVKTRLPAAHKEAEVKDAPSLPPLIPIQKLSKASSTQIIVYCHYSFLLSSANRKN